MIINVKTSVASRDLIREYTQLLNLDKRNVIARIALAYSLSKGMKLDPNEDSRDSGGMEYKEETLFGRYRDYYVALICEHYGIYRTNPDIPKLVKLHIDHGLESIQSQVEQTPNFTLYDFLFSAIERGIETVESGSISLDPVANPNQFIQKDIFDGLIKLDIGHPLDDPETRIELHLNDLSARGNAHIAIAGTSGMGKTQFALEVLRQIYEQSQGTVNFIYLDFKGMQPGDAKKNKAFFDATGCTLIDAPQKPFPLNPLGFIDLINETNKIMGINKFVDIIVRYANAGENQEQVLKDAVKNLFEQKKKGEYPDLREIYEEVLDELGDRRNRLTKILDGLSEVPLFEKKYDPTESFIQSNYYLSLSGSLPESVRFTAVFLVINYIYNTFMNMEDTPVTDDRVKSLRYVLLIDEAHTIFKERKSQDLLEKILREIRSKGVSVVLLSQGIAEFNQPSFDFSSMCETAFLLKLKDKANQKLVSKFMGYGEPDWKRAKSSLERIETGQAIANIGEFRKGELFALRQFWMKKATNT